MTSSRRLPTSLLVLVAVAVVAAGALWWSRSAPEAVVPAGPVDGESLLFVQLQNGAVVAYPGGPSTDFTGSPRQLDRLDQLTSAQWPCRVDPPGRRRFDLMNDTIDVLPRDGTRIIRLPRCGGVSSAGR